MDKNDLDKLEILLNKADKVVAMEDISNGMTSNKIIGLRHDVDHDIDTAVKIAEWENKRGFRSTYFILHTAKEYWMDKGKLVVALATISSLGHEIGIHNNAIAEFTSTGRSPDRILMSAIQELRDYGYEIRGTVAHGDQRCYLDGHVNFVNDEIFKECNRLNNNVFSIKKYPLSYFDLDYDANWLTRGYYLSDSGGNWNHIFDNASAGFPYPGQTHILWHPCWWKEVFDKI